MNKLNVKSGDTVLVIAGKENGKTAKVLATNPAQRKVLVEGVNVISKCQKAKTAQDKSTIIKKEALISVSNVLVVCPECKKATRVAHKEINGKNVRICKKCGAVLDMARVIKKENKKVAKKVEKPAEEVAKVEEKKVAKKPATKKTTTAKKTTTKKVATKKEA